MASDHQGGCVCGAVRYVAHGDPARVTICHCTWCQRRTGSAFGVEAVYEQSRVSFLGRPIRAYRHVSEPSGRWLDQYFCTQCGTNLGLTLEAAPGTRSIPAGTFDDPSWLTRDRIRFRDIYMRSARDWSELPAGAEQHQAHFLR
jgi:hypothetical protein